MAFKIASSPHVSTTLQTNKVMLRVAYCLIPGILAQTYFFGMGTLVQIIIAVVTALSAEACIMKLRNKSIKTALADNSALVTALLIAVAIPPLTPWWMTVIGCLFAIVIVKHLYGGLGNNIFNPAMAAYVLLLVSFPVQMTSWVAPAELASNHVGIIAALNSIFELSNVDIHLYRLGIDGHTMATPLDTFKTDLSMGLTSAESLQKNVFDGIAGVGWLWVNIAYLLGGLVMLKLKVIRWQISTGILLAIFICAGVGFLLNPSTHASPLLHLFSGGTMLCAFFIATDPVTAATSPRGRLLFGAIIGVLIFVIRTYGGYPDAVAFAVLLANMCAPFIDYYIRPRSYGHRAGN
ncbi:MULTISPECIES: electron transport complex subunit RsxD [unclassified Shewanella]|uniref:electron transport complex subunit RsxD n=1 Tax=unclassified Shewanella TaxID=196818 RepID=UPI000C85F057|nr:MULTISPECIES: electron transport complex subunit RsxD [unclassified Shewanella]MDO6776895.1 electron transport complex subunit RsxD [Shewanella sp. 3_MG-2023]PMG49699.1 electron transport complex subunit RsxD [Shewanella sp. 10N.286.52.B9]PMH87821.1 electron transport complex subunit RsxD [Shewanella sp. 10N.286.48.B5]PMH97172.1 electron transport complex subunit RsxD [Shewanella sp. 10N.286.48.A6]